MNLDVGTSLTIAGLLIAALAAWWARKALAPQKQSQTQDLWVSERQNLNTSRADLSKYAAHLHIAASSKVRAIGGTSMLAIEGWTHLPIPLQALQVTFTNGPAPDQASFLDVARGILPMGRHGRRYALYSEAMGDFARPALFDNRVSYRLVNLEMGSDGRTKMQFTTCRYFEMLNIAEPLAHELSNAVASIGTVQHARIWRQLPLRKMLRHDPFRISDRVILPSIGTLLLRVADDGSARFLLHKRDTSAVAIAGGHYSLVPAGVFQPSSASPASIDEDLDLWRSIQREVAEELLGIEEAIGETGVPIDYENDEPFASFERARAEGDLAVWSLGWGIDPLTLTLELLTVLTVKAAAYDVLGIVERNPEGKIVAAGRTGSGLKGFAFTAETIEGLSAKGELSPVADACLEVALRHKAVLLPESR
ncbi:hypothetical protein ACFXNW_06300 [Nocardia sp. NPDC059180]|uniref:hypothetical protein n=1 Tax=Nocardia sp. NPDC059180 TaxID=3346761 RepID=UPI0036917901